MERSVFFLFALILAGCVSPSAQFDKMAKTYDLEKNVISTLLFKHVVYKNAAKPRGTINIYIGGDGTPWINGRHVSPDPTQSSPVILSLLASDKSSALILGRPCYHKANDVACDNSNNWTFGRYSKAVTDSMSQAIDKLKLIYNVNEINLIGYSGGGTLAVLIAKQRTDISTVVTFAGNLNLVAWTTHHNVLPLHNSIDPLTLDNSTKTAIHHFIALKDSNVLPHFYSAYQQKHGNEYFHPVPNIDHNCCWTKLWETQRESILGSNNSG